MVVGVMLLYCCFDFERCRVENSEIVAGRGTEHRQTESFLRAWVGDRQKLEFISTNRLFVDFNGRQADELKGMLSNSSVRHLCADLIW